MPKKKKKTASNPYSKKPHSGTTAVYLRVSTEDQTLHSQENAIQEWLDKNPEYAGRVREYRDIGISGASTSRPAFNAMIEHAEKGLISAVVTYKLDRLSRMAIQGIRTILRFDELGIRFVAVSQPMFSHGTPMRHAMIAIFAELAQMEREQIVERVKAGISAAKKRGVVFGAPKKVTPEIAADISRLRADGFSYKKIAEAVGLSVGAVHKCYMEIKKNA